MANVRVGVLVLPECPYPELVRRWQQTETMGFDQVWTCDHLLNPFRPSELWFEGVASLAALAATTSTIRIGSLVFSMTLRDPAVLARAAVTVDHISGGRVELAVGAAGAPLDHDLTGVPAWPPSERARRFGAWTRRLVDVLEQGGPGGLGPRPVQDHIPLTVAAHGSRSLEVAARYADVWNGFGPRDAAWSAVVSWFREMGRRLDERLAARGRDPAAVRRSALLDLFPTTTWRTVAEFEDRVGALVDVGVTDVVTYWPTPTLPATVERGVGALEAVAHQALPRRAGFRR
ncbi:MAG: LLM class flavin-dependent oxidoreductase [Acidimicrobiales bacterium]